MQISRSVLLTTVLSCSLASVAFAKRPQQQEPEPETPPVATDVVCEGCIEEQELTGQLQQRIIYLETKTQEQQEQLDNLSFHANKRVVVKDRDGVVIGLPASVEHDSNAYSSIWLNPLEGDNRPTLTQINIYGKFARSGRVYFVSADCTGQGYLQDYTSPGERPVALKAIWVAGDSLWIPDERSVVESIVPGSMFYNGGSDVCSSPSPSSAIGLIPADEIPYYPPFTFEYE